MILCDREWINHVDLFKRIDALMIFQLSQIMRINIRHIYLFDSGNLLPDSSNLIDIVFPGIRVDINTILIFTKTLRAEAVLLLIKIIYVIITIKNKQIL